MTLGNGKCNCQVVMNKIYALKIKGSALNLHVFKCNKKFHRTLRTLGKMEATSRHRIKYRTGGFVFEAERRCHGGAEHVAHALFRLL